MSFSDYKTALVTGATSGIGAGLVERLAKEGMTVHAVGRRKDRLDALVARTGCIAHAVDVRDTAAMEEVITPLPIDVLVNNAGVNRDGSITTATAQHLDDIVDVDLAAVLQVTRMALPGMMARDLGHIINIGSISGLQSFPGHAAYHAVKAGVHALSRQLRIDLHGKRIRVTEICPGRTATEIFAQTIGDEAEARKRFIDGFATLQVADIVESIAFAIAMPWHVNVSLMEIWPTYQVSGGLHFARPDQTEAG
ncbi:MAG: SDR family oxidoreductase [Rhizobiaceae bacterium]|nr:SDR family oxidoreductase [Rhizobiaceae bacterium]